jgi:diguanylate cyclase (GGDEF)-like protein
MAGDWKMKTSIPAAGAIIRTTSYEASAYSKSWLCPTPLDRARLLELDGRLRPAMACGITVIVLLLIIGRPWALLPVPAFILIAGVLPRLAPRMRRPEYAMLGAGVLLFASLAAATAKSGGLGSPLFVWSLAPALGIATRFTDVRRIVSVAGAALITFISVLVVADPHAIGREPLELLGFIAAFVSFTAISTMLVNVEVQYRGESVLDPLTGLLNRRALASRFDELAQQAALLGTSLCVVACDLDHFKRINDRFGHQAGDAVLKDVAYEMRKALRQFELVYRVGGEEFLILFAGLDAIQGAERAERVRTRILLARPGGLDVTMSMGVSSARGGASTLAALHEEADAALYTAKRNGRNRVEIYSPTTAPSPCDTAGSIEPAHAHS